MEMGRAEPCPYEIRGTRYNVFSLGIFAHWMKRHVSGRPHGVRTRPLSLILADAKSSLLGRFFLLPTKAELLRERGGVGAQSEGFSQENRAIAPGDDDGSRLSLAD